MKSPCTPRGVIILLQTLKHHDHAASFSVSPQEDLSNMRTELVGLKLDPSSPQLQTIGQLKKLVSASELVHHQSFCVPRAVMLSFPPQ